MTNEREEEAVVRAKREALTREGLRVAVLQTKDEVEIPLRDALRMIHVLGMIDTPKTDDDVRSVAYVAREAAIRLETVGDELRGLFRACLLEI
jgi:hypothetical protein